MEGLTKKPEARGRAVGKTAWQTFRQALLLWRQSPQNHNTEER